MDPITSVLIPSLVGGLVIAFLIARYRWRGSGALSNAPGDPSTSTDVINMARIRAAGVGGLGLVAMALVVAWFVPRIGLTLGVGALLGFALGVGLILRRRRTGPLPTSSGTAGANVVLSIDSPAAAEKDDTDGPSNRAHITQSWGHA